MKRLARSAKSYRMDPGYSVDEMVEAAKEVVRANEFSSAYIRPIVFLGLGALGLDPRNANVQVAIITWPRRPGPISTRSSPNGRR